MGDVDPDAVVLANAFLKQMGSCLVNLHVNTRTNLNELYDASEGAWWPEEYQGSDDVSFSSVLYAMARGDLPDTRLRAVVRHGREISWKKI